MFFAFDTTNTEPVPTIADKWGEEWERYLNAVIRGFILGTREIEEQLQAVCYRERLEPEIGFAFHIGHKFTEVEIFLRIKELDRFLSLNLKPSNWLSLHFVLETKKELENDMEWEKVAEHRAQVAARHLAADLARNGLPAEVKRCIALIAQFSKLLYESCVVLKWHKVQSHD